MLSSHGRGITMKLIILANRLCLPHLVALTGS